MFINFLPNPNYPQTNFTDRQDEILAYDSVQIGVREFADIDWDARGWYAIGHHDPEQFIAAVAKREPDEQLLESHVEHTWARIAGQWVEWVDEPIEFAQPVTVILLLDPL